MLIPAETSSAGENRQQYNTIRDIEANAPTPPWTGRFVDLLMAGGRFGGNVEQQRRGQSIVRKILADQNQRNRYADNIANYLITQNHLFRAPTAEQIAWIEFAVRSLLNAAYRARKEKTSAAQGDYNALREAIIEAAPDFGLNPNIPARAFVDMVLRLPGFQATDNGLTLSVHGQLANLDAQMLAARSMERAFSLPTDIAERILLIALMSHFGL